MATGHQEQAPETGEENIIMPEPATWLTRRRKIFTGAVFLMVLITFGLLFIPKLFKPKETPIKSIAVLPFKLLRDEPDKQFLADRMMDAITLHLSKMKDLRVIARTSVEQYRTTTKTIHEIGRELNVQYLLEGSFQKSGENTKFIVQLIRASDESHAWPYLFKVFNHWRWKGPSKELMDVLLFVNPEDEWYLFSWYFQEIGEGNLQKAICIADTTKSWGVSNKMWTIPRTSLLATIYKHQGETELAGKYYNEAAAILEKNVAEVPNDPRYHSALGIALAGIGKKEEAISEGFRAVDLLPVSKDAMYGLGVFRQNILDSHTSVSYL